MFTLYAYVTVTREGNHPDKLDKPDKGLQPLSEHSDGGVVVGILLLNDYFFGIAFFYIVRND